jgi:hypothetical protein
MGTHGTGGRRFLISENQFLEGNKEREGDGREREGGEGRKRKRTEGRKYGSERTKLF